MKKITLLLFVFLNTNLFFGQTCSPISPLDCDNVEVTLPINFDFNLTSPNTVLDKNNFGTGFTAVLENSEARRAGDIPISDANLNGYEPSLLTLGPGRLEILSQGGIAYLNPPASSSNNNQINTLGVGFDNLAKGIHIKTTLLNIVTGGNAAQAGIWYGYDEDNFVKLNVNDNNIELRVEEAGFSVNSTQQIQLNLGASGNDVILEMLIDPLTLTAEAFYTIGAGARTQLGFLAIPATYITGRDINGAGGQDNMSFAGIFATHRSGSQFTASFDDFSVEEVIVPFEAHVNFQDVPTSTTAPAGYLADYGREFGFSNVTVGSNNYQYGWFNAADDQPINTTGNGGAGRNRIAGSYATASIQDQLVGTLMHFQGDNIGSWNGQNRGSELYWELEIPNGTYEVTLGLGDKSSSIDSRHSATVEGYTVISAFEPVPQETKVASIIVAVTDGRLTINGLGGFNSKITHIDVVESTGIPASGILAFAPSVVSESLVEGTTGNFTSDLTGSGASSISLIINDDITIADDWVTLPGSAALGNLSFTTDATTLVVSDTRADIIIATAVGFVPATLNADLTVIEQSNDFSFIENFEYTPGPLKAASSGAWDPEDSNGTDKPDVSVVAGGLTSGTTNSVNITNVNTTIDYLTLINNPVDLTDGQPFYFGTYFKFSEISNATNSPRVRVAIRVDDDTPADEHWVRQIIGRYGGEIKARLGLAGSNSNAAQENLYADQLYQFVVKGVWNATLSTISYEYSLSPALSETSTNWSTVSTSQAVSGTPSLGRIFISSTSTANTGSLGPIRLSTDYSEVVTELVDSDPLAAFTSSISDLTLDVDASASLDDGSIASYTWDFGDGNAGSEQSTSHTYANDGTFTVALTVTDNVGNTSVATEEVTVEAPFVATFPYQINFQDAGTTPPAGYVKDFGLPYGTNEGGLTYGWIKLSDGQANDLTTPSNGSGRNRAVGGVDLLLNTLVHIQGNDIPSWLGTSRGNEGVWEIALANGWYEVTVAVGDPETDGNPADSPIHYVNVEGTTAIPLFAVDANLPAGDSGRFQNNTVIVQVEDGKLTIDADDEGAFRTKINYATIAQSTDPRSIETDILTFVFSEDPAVAIVDDTSHTVTVEVANGTDLTILTPAITLSDGATVIPGSGIIQDFTNALTYTITAEDETTTQDWLVTVTEAPSAENEILTFVLPEETGTATIDVAAFTVFVEVANGTNLTALVPTIVVSADATISPLSGVAQDFSTLVTYTVTAEDGTTTQDWAVTVNEAPSIATDITLFTLAEQTGVASINTTDNTVTVEVANGADLTALVPTIEVSADATVNPLSGVAQDFSTSIIYTVTAQDGTTSEDWAVTVNEAPSIATDITVFTLVEQTGVASINTTDNTVTIEVANGTDLTALVPTIEVSADATVNPLSGVTQDFSAAVTYTVTAEDGTTTQDWAVTVNEAPSIATDITLFTLAEQTGVASINTTDNTVIIEVANGADLTALVPTIEVSADATVNPLSGVAQDFSTSIIYTVTAQDGTTSEDWTVTVTEAPSIATDITLFTLAEQTTTATINTTDNTVTIEVANGTVLTALVTTIEVSLDATISPLSGVAQDFSSAVIYTVTAEDGTTTEDWTVTVNEAPSIATDITLFSLVDQTGTASINTTDNTVTIEVVNGTDLTALVPTIEVSADATINPLSGEAQDFSVAVSYTVTAENGITSEAWTVIATEAAPPANTENEILTFSFPEETGSATIDAALFTVTLQVAAGTDITTLSPTIALSSGATVVPNSGSEQDFTTPVNYAVTAEDGTSVQTWTVIVTEEVIPFAARVNFSDKGRVPPAGFVVDYGKNFGFSSVLLGADSYDYGWKLATDSTPFDASDDVANNVNGIGRNRLGGGYDAATDVEKLEGTLVHFQGDNIRNDAGIASWAGQARGNEIFWELEIPNGVYEVTLGLGDKSANQFDSRHSATIESYTIIPAFVPASTETKVATLIVEVTDGLLTMNGLGGYNSKITHIEVVESAGTPVNGVLSFNPSTTSQILVAEENGAFSSTLSGSGATDIGLVINDNVNTVSKTITDSNDWLTIPSTSALGQFDFDMTAVGIAAGEVRSNTIIATANGFIPAILEADLTIELATCTPISTLDCEDVVVALPINLDFAVPVANTIFDLNDAGTGFTAVLEHSEARRPGDLAISNASLNGYEPSLLTLNGGALEIVSQAGIAYLNPPASSNNNNQVNTLGVGLDNLSETIIIKTTLLNIITADGSAQAGLWFGFDEDNFVKLDVNNDNLELRVERAGASANNTTDQLQQNVGASGNDVILEMLINPTDLSVEAFYTIGAGARTSLGSLLMPANYFTGRDINVAGGQDNVTFAGIFATHRNGAQFTASFDDFSVETAPVVTIPPVVLAQTFNISEEATIGDAVGTVVATDADTDVADLTFAVTAGNDDGTFAIDAATGNITTVTLLDFAVTSQYTLTVAVSDGDNTVSADMTINVTDISEPLPCNPLSNLPCNQIETTLPLSLDFTITNGNLSESGLTMVLEPSARLASDDALADANVPGYATSLITQGSAGLSITSTKGIFYSQPVGEPSSNNTNSQMNALGVGITIPSAPFSITSTLENPNFSGSTGNSAQQAGIWFGLDEDHYIKLAVIKTGTTSRKVQLQVENMDNTTAATAYLEINTGNIASETGDITLRMELDPINNTVKGYYTLDGGTEILVSDGGGDFHLVPTEYFDGTSYDTANPSNELNFAGIFTTHRNAAVDQSITAVFKDFEIVAEDVPLALFFSETELNFSGIENEVIAPQSVTVSATSGNPVIILSDDPDASSWLVIPTSPVLGELEFGIQPNLPIGTYSTTIIVIDEPDLGYANAELNISLDVTEETNDFATKINFSDLATAPPTGYERDSGLPFGDRGNGFNYGWLETNGTALLNLSANGRNRGNGSVSVLQNTLIHMQYGDTGGSNGNTTEGIWEIEVPDGSYNVIVGVGDPDNDSSNPQHTINAEGISLVDKFVPSGAAGSAGHFESGSAVVIVSDGRLTIDASGGQNTKINSIEIIATNGGVQTPTVVGVTPVDGAVNVSVHASISANELFVPNPDSNGIYGVNNSTITVTTVRLFKQGSTSPVASSVNGTGGGDAISLVPSLPLEPNTTYVFEIDGVQDIVGETFAFFTSSFTTGNGGTGPTTDLDNVSFTNAGVVGSGGKYSTLTIGPDDKLYGLNINGDIHRWNMAADGTLNGEEVLTAWKSSYASRAAIGLAFAPNATATNLIAYITHQSGALSNAPDWDGKISRISGANLETEQLLVTDLPRSLKDHLTNSIAFNPAEPNVLYYNQGSNSAAGAPDNSWGNREESLLTAANLRLDLSLLPATLPLNARTTRNVSAINNVDTNSPTLDGLYNPYYINAPLTLFATGIRNAYDLVWHSNGQLYIPTNGTAGGSNAPASVNGTRRPDGTIYDHSNPLYPVIPASNGNNTQRDWLFRVDPNSTLGYYGHPNPFRGEFVLNRGDADVNNAVYNGVQADPNYKGAAFDFEFNKSPNGVIEYRSDAENGNLKGALLVVRYSGGSDIIALVPDGPNGDITTFKEGIPGFTGFQDPLDLVENVNNGNIYVSDYGRSQIVLLKPNNAVAPEPLIVLNTEEVTGDAITNSNTYTQELIISNLGNAILTNISAQIAGTDDNQFSIVGLPASVNVQNSGSFQVVFTPTTNGPKFAELTLSGTDADPVIVQLNGLGKTGLGGGNEPSLQWILDTQLGSGVVNVGDTDPATNLINLPNGTTYNSLLGDELNIQKFERAIEAPITLELLSVYGPTNTNPVVAFGWYESGDATSTNELFTVTNSPASNGQTLNAPITGASEFDPGIATFGFYSRWPFFGDRQLYSEDALNTFANAIPHHVRVYELPGEDNAYIIATEEHISGFDYQDIVVIVRNIRPFGGLPTIAATPGELIFEVTSNNDGSNTNVQTVEVSNDGNEVLNITGASITGAFANQFNAVQPSGAVTLNPGENQIYTVTYAPDLDNSNLGYQDASLVIESNANANPSLSIGLHALKKLGFDGGEEPSLQAVVDALGIGIDVGWTSLTNNTNANPVGDESEVELWIRATNAPINVTPVGRYSPAETLPFGWYTNDNSVVTNEIGVLSGDVPQSQTLFPEVASGDASFDPQGAVFGFYVESNTFNRLSYTEDAINTGGVQHRTRIYPMADRDGNAIENSYLIAFEDASNGDYQDYIFIIDNVIPFEDGTLVMNFDKQDLDFVASLNQTDVPEQQVTLSANGGITTGEVTLSTSEAWVVLPSNYDLGSPFDIAVDIAGLSIGMYQATVTASAPNYADAVINVDLSVTNELVYTYQFNFQDPDDIEVSPTGYIDDIGVPYGVQNTTLGDLTFGWVLPGTLTPADASVNGRNRSGDALLSTFTIIGHRTPANFPQLDWVANVPNGTYSVNISVGDPDFTDSNHVLDVNGNTVIDFDQQNNNPGNLASFENTNIVEVTDGTLRLSLGTGGANAKPNYIRLAPFDISLFSPTIVATFDGNISSSDTYRGVVDISLEAIDESQSGGISRLEYVLDGNSVETYTTPISVTTEGTHILVVTSEDNNGNVSEKTYNFTIETPTGALLTLENMTKIPGTDRGFPADDYYTFYRLGTPGEAEVHDSNIMRLNNSGTGDLVVTEVNVSDVNDYTFELLDAAGVPALLPISIPTGSFADLAVTFIGTTGNGNNGIFVETIEVVSNADNALNNTAVLHGGYAPQPEGGDEINAQEVFDAFGFQSSMLSIVNDNGTITPVNGTPFRPSSNYPDAANIDAGYEGDLVLSDTFVQADPSKPVIGLQLSALHGGPGSNGASFFSTNSGDIVGGMSFSHGSAWYQTLFPKNIFGNINFDSANTISTPFRINLAGQLTDGRTNTEGQELLGVRLYKVIDHKGNVVPNEYIGLMDFIGNGCGAGSANCDWNDNTFYFINIRPEAVPMASPTQDLLVNVEESFEVDINQFFDKGYPGNTLEITANTTTGTLPVWISFNTVTATLEGTPPSGTTGSVVVTFDAEDTNGLSVSTTLTININEAPVAENDTALTEQNVVVNLDQLLVNDSEPNGEDITIVTVETPQNGTAELNLAGTEVLYAPNTDFIGIDNFSYTIEDESGLSATANVAVTVTATNQAPVAVISTNTITGPAALFVQFTGSGSTDDNNNIVNYEWNFGDTIGTSQDADTEYIFNSVGVYQASLTVTDNFGITNTTSIAITVTGVNNTAPNAVVSVTPINGPNSLEFDFNGSGSSDTESTLTYEWSFGDGTPISTVVQTSHTYVNSGNYTVTLTVTDAGNLSDIQTVNLQVGESVIQPLANAGADQTITLPNNSIALNGSGSDPDGGAVSFEWSQISGPNTASFTGGNSSELTASNLIEGDYVFRLTVTDDESMTAFDEVTITINSANNSNELWLEAECAVVGSGWSLVSDANVSEGQYVSATSGSDFYSSAPTNADFWISFDFTASAATYNMYALINTPNDNNDSFWVRANGGTWVKWNGLLRTGFNWRQLYDSDSNADLVSFDLVQGTNTLDIAIRENGASIDKIHLSAATTAPTGLGQQATNCGPIDTLPLSDAGTDLTLTLPDNTTILSGTGSDPDGGLVSYLWTQLSGPNTAVLTDDDTTVVTAEGLIEGTYVFSLGVTDEEGNTVSDDVSVLVEAAFVDQQPIVDAGTDLSLTLPDDTTLLSGTGSDPDGGLVSYLWTQISGPNTATLTGANTTDLTVAGLIEGTYVFSLGVTDEEGNTVSDDVSVLVSAVTAPSDVWLEAECATVGSGWSLVSDANVSEGQYVLATSGSNFYSSAPTNADSWISFDFTASAATYNMYALINTPNDNNDSFWVRANGGTWVKWNGLLRTGFNWRQLYDSDSNADLVSFDLVEGANTLDIAIRENGASIDKIYLSSATTTAPTGLGQQATNCGPIDTLPLSDAGTDLTLTLPDNTTLLSGTGSDPDGGLVSYLWTQISGPNTATLADADTTDLTVAGLIEGTYVFGLAVTDEEGNTVSDDVSVLVEAAFVDQQPIVDAGTGLSLTLPDDTTLLSGTGSDPDGGLVSYLWTQISGPNTATLTNANTTDLTVAGLIEGTYVFGLAVTDEEGNTVSDQVSLSVEAVTAPSDVWLEAECAVVGSGWSLVSDVNASEGQFVSATSGSDFYSSAPTNTDSWISFDFTATTGTYNMYALVNTPNTNNDSFWVRANGGAWIKWNNLLGASFDWRQLYDSDSNADLVSFDLLQGANTLDVAIRENGASIDKIYLSSATTTAPTGLGQQATNCGPIDTLPLSDAGTDLTLTLPDNTTILSGTGSDPDGGLVSYLWTQISGPNTATLADADTTDLTVAGLIEGTYVFGLAVTDEEGNTVSDQVSVLVSAVTAPSDVWLEAECAVVGSGWSLVSDANVSEGQYVTATSGDNFYFGAPTNADSWISFDFTAAAGTYNMYALINTPNDNNDSFWVRANGGTWIKWNGLLRAGFDWRQLYDSDSNADLVSFDLAEGANTLDIAIRENGASIDKIYLSDTATEPTGLGQQATNCGTVIPELAAKSVNDVTMETIVATDNDVKSIANYYLYPNPARSTTSLQIDDSEVLSSLDKIIAYDLTGRKVAEYDAATIYNGREFVIPVSKLENGVYLINVVTKDSQIIHQQKLIVKK